MTREEYHAQKALREKRRATERKSYEASKGSMDLSFLLLTLLLTGIGLVMMSVFMGLLFLVLPTVSAFFLYPAIAEARFSMK